MTDKLTQTRLKELLTYNHLTGDFHWNVTMNRGRIKKGDLAGITRSDGVRYIGIDKKMYIASKIAWLYVHGYVPTVTVKKVSGNSLAIDNLKLSIPKQREFIYLDRQL
jgi:hypothetical protein